MPEKKTDIETIATECERFVMKTNKTYENSSFPKYFVILLLVFFVTSILFAETKKSKHSGISKKSSEKTISKSKTAEKKDKKDRSSKIKKTSISSETTKEKSSKSESKKEDKSSKGHSKKNQPSLSHHSSKKKVERKKAASLPPLPELDTDTPYDELTYKDPEYNLTIRAKSFQQGNMAFLKLESASLENRLDISKYKARWRKKEVPLLAFQRYHIALLPIHPDEAPGLHYLEIEKTEETKIITKKFPITIEKTNFPERKMYSVLRLPKKTKGYSEETLAFIRKCEAKKKEAFNSESDLLIDGKFVKPLNKLYITSPFYVKRYYRPGVAKPHGGTDFRARVGEPIYALQTGRVVIAERMFFEGIFTVIDHGSKMFSLYMHQSKIFVKEGDIVKKGTLIGEAGSTGMSTGPHLHLGLKVDGVMVNPLSVIDQDLF